MSNTLRVCAVVVTYNRADLLRLTLESIQQQTILPAHVVVVDNASTDETEAVLALFEKVEVVRLARNEGASGGFAAGIGHAAAQGWDALWVMDDDVEARPDALQHLLAELGPGVAAVGSLKVGTDGQVQALHAGEYSVGRMRIGKAAVQPGEAARAVGYLSFVSLLIRGVVAQAEKPDASFFIGHDDVEYALRLRRHGTLRVVPESVVVHHNSQAAQTRRVLGRTVVPGGTWRIYYAMRNPLLIARLHGSRREQLTSAGVGALRLVLRLAAALVYHRGDLRRWRLAVHGYRDGLRGKKGRVVKPSDYR